MGKVPTSSKPSGSKVVPEGSPPAKEEPSFVARWVTIRNEAAAKKEMGSHDDAVAEANNGIKPEEEVLSNPPSDAEQEVAQAKGKGKATAKAKGKRKGKAKAKQPKMRTASAAVYLPYGAPVSARSY